MKGSFFICLGFGLCGLFLGSVHAHAQYVQPENPRSFERIWSMPKTVEPILAQYPFLKLNPPITIAEGFEAYDGNLYDVPGERHWGIDYVRKVDGTYRRFSVFSMHDGSAFQSEGELLGKFVVVRKRSDAPQGYNTVYAHLEDIPESIPFIDLKAKGFNYNTNPGVTLPVGSYIGKAGYTGNTKGIPQLHFELHLVDKLTGVTLRADPYGAYARLSSGKYPQVGKTLATLPHFWASSTPAYGKFPKKNELVLKK